MRKTALQLVSQTLKKNENELLAKANVVGVGIGEKIKGGLSTGRLCLKIYVEKKIPKKELDVPPISRTHS